MQKSGWMGGWSGGWVGGLANCRQVVGDAGSGCAAPTDQLNFHQQETCLESNALPEPHWQRHLLAHP